MERELLLRREKLPRTTSPEELLAYILNSMGIRKNTEAYIEILRKIYREGLTTTEISRGVAKRTTTIYYVKKLMKMGFIVKRGSRYELRENTLERTLYEIKRDVDRIFEDLMLLAKRIDERW